MKITNRETQEATSGAGEGISRRAFLKGAAATGLAVVFGGLVACGPDNAGARPPAGEDDPVATEPGTPGGTTEGGQPNGTQPDGSTLTEGAPGTITPPDEAQGGNPNMPARDYSIYYPDRCTNYSDMLERAEREHQNLINNDKIPAGCKIISIEFSCDANSTVASGYLLLYETPDGKRPVSRFNFDYES
jgi:hypothetical protein